MPAASAPAAAAPADEAPIEVRTAPMQKLKEALTRTPSHTGKTEGKDCLQRKVGVLRCRSQAKSHSASEGHESNPDADRRKSQCFFISNETWHNTCFVGQKVRRVCANNLEGGYDQGRGRETASDIQGAWCRGCPRVICFACVDRLYSTTDLFLITHRLALSRCAVVHTKLHCPLAVMR